MYPKKLCMFPFVFLVFKCSKAIVILEKWTVFDQFGDETGLVYDQSYVEFICLCKDSPHCKHGVMQVINGTKDVVKEMRDTKGNGLYQIQFPIKPTVDLGEYKCQLNISAEISNKRFNLNYRLCAPEEVDVNCTLNEINFCYAIKRGLFICIKFDHLICLVPPLLLTKTCQVDGDHSKTACHSFKNRKTPMYITSQSEACENFQLRSVTDATKNYMLGEYVLYTNGTFKFKVHCTGSKLSFGNVDCHTKMRGNKDHKNKSGKCGREMVMQLEKDGSYIAKLICTSTVGFTATTFIFLVSMNASVQITQNGNVLKCDYLHSTNDKSFKYKPVTWIRNDEETRIGNYPFDNKTEGKPFFRNGTFRCIGTVVFLASSPYTRLQTTEGASIVFSPTVSVSITTIHKPQTTSKRKTEAESLIWSIYRRNKLFFYSCCSAAGCVFLFIFFVSFLLYDKWFGDPRDLSCYNKALKNSVLIKDKVKRKEKIDFYCKDIAGGLQETKAFAEKYIGNKKDDQKASGDTSIPTRFVETSRAKNLPCLNDKIFKGFEKLHLSCIKDLYNFNIFLGPSPLVPECELFWKFVVKQKISVMICLEMCGEREKLNQFFPTSSQIVVSFEKYRIAVVSRRFRPICSVYDFEIFYNNKVVQQLVLIIANRRANVWPMSVNYEMFQKKLLDYIGFVACMRERNMQAYGYRNNSGMIVVDAGEALKAPGFVTVFIARQLLLQYGCINEKFLFKYVRKHVFGAFTWNDNNLLQIDAVLTLIGNMGRQFIPEELPPFWVTKISTSAENKFFQQFQMDPERMDDADRASQHYKKKTDQKWKDKSDDELQRNPMLKTTRGPFRRVKPKKGGNVSRGSVAPKVAQNVSQMTPRFGASTTNKAPLLKENSQY